MDIEYYNRNDRINVVCSTNQVSELHSMNLVEAGNTVTVGSVASRHAGSLESPLKAICMCVCVMACGASADASYFLNRKFLGERQLDSGTSERHCGYLHD